MRQPYGYSSTSNIIAVSFRFISIEVETAATSAMDVVAIAAQTYNATNFKRLGTGTSNMISPLKRGTFGSKTTQSLPNPVDLFYTVLVPSGYGSSDFTLMIYNAVTLVAISTSDYVNVSMEITEHVSQY